MTREEVKHLSDVLKAYSEGKDIQVKKPNGWVTIVELKDDATMLLNPEDYRIKPEPKYIPYANAKEFLKAQKEHGPHILYDKFGYNIITQIEQDSIWINPNQLHQKISFSNLINYKWQDGTPCGTPIE